MSRKPRSPVRHVLPAALCLLGTPALAKNTPPPPPIEVTPRNLGGWQPQHTGTAAIDFVNGPAQPPMGVGSVQLTVGVDGNSVAQLRQPQFSGTQLHQLTTLRYSTFVAINANCQAPYLILSIDTNQDGIPDDLLYFEPCYQTGTYIGDPVPNQCGGPDCVVKHQWQSWDALHGGWWAFSQHSSGPPLQTMAHYIKDHPGARIVNAQSGLGGVHIAAGGGAGAWDDFLGYADALIMEGPGRHSYNFEADHVCHRGIATGKSR